MFHLDKRNIIIGKSLKKIDLLLHIKYILTSYNVYYIKILIN